MSEQGSGGFASCGCSWVDGSHFPCAAHAQADRVDAESLARVGDICRSPATPPAKLTFAEKCEKATALFEVKVRAAVAMAVGDGAMGNAAIAEIVEEFRRFLAGGYNPERAAPAEERREPTPESLRALAEWFDSPNKSPSLSVWPAGPGGMRFTPGYLLRQIADALGKAESEDPA